MKILDHISQNSVTSSWFSLCPCTQLEDVFIHMAQYFIIIVIFSTLCIFLKYVLCRETSITAFLLTRCVCLPNYLKQSLLSVLKENTKDLRGKRDTLNLDFLFSDQTKERKIALTNTCHDVKLHYSEFLPARSLWSTCSF